MKKLSGLSLGLLLITSTLTQAQTKDPVVEGIVKEATENSQLEKLAHE
jgi:carboxypeptidase Q